MLKMVNGSKEVHDMWQQVAKSKRAVIIGNGKSAESAGQLLLKLGFCVQNYDDKLFITKLEDKSFLSSLSLVVLSPGAIISQTILDLLNEKDVLVLGELELAFLFCDASIIAITGTDGKTTTTKLTEHILKDRNARAVGNVGVGFAGEIAKRDESPFDIAVCEVSSFQAESFLCFKPKIAMLLNLSPDHIDRHNTYENYIAQKLKIFACQDKSDFAVLNFDEPEVMKYANQLNSNVFYFSTKSEVRGCFVRDGCIYFKDKFELPICKVSSIKLVGKHNLENCLASALACVLLGVDANEIALGLATALPLAHRYNFVESIYGVNFYDASKATNVHSALACLSLIGSGAVVLGGSSKGENYDELFEYLATRSLAVVVCGDNAVSLVGSAKKFGVDCVCVNKFQTAVRVAFMFAKQLGGDVALIPASASFDKFKSYVHRGECFGQTVIELKRKYEDFSVSKF